MSVSISRTSLLLALAELNVARIAAISATISIHIVAFLFLLVPVEMPERIILPETHTTVTLIEPPKVEPIKPELIQPTNKPVDVVNTKPNPQTSVTPDVSEPYLDAISTDIGDIQIQKTDIGDSFKIGVGGGDVVASTRAQFPIDYPIAALRTSAEGVVLVLAHYNSSGTVTETSIERSSRNKELDRAALKGVKRWKINPAFVQGQAIGGSALVEVEFKL